MLAAICAGIYAAIKDEFKEIFHKNTYQDLFKITLLVVVLPYTLFYWGAKMTSGMNCSILLLSEIIFTLIFTHFFGEKTTVLKLLGSLGVFIGALFILYDGKFLLNWGDLIIILSTLSYPLGNFFSKRALLKVSPSIILFVRFLLGGFFIVFLSFIIEKWSIGPVFTGINLFYFLLNGLIFLGLSRIFWYEGLKLLDISKANALEMTFPLFSIAVLVIFFHEKVSIFNTIGVIVMIIGIFFSIKRASIKSEYTNYGKIKS